MELNKILIIVLLAFCFTNLIGVRITNKTGKDIWIQKAGLFELDWSKLTNNKKFPHHVEIKNGQFIDIEINELEGLFGCSTEETALTFFRLPILVDNYIPKFLNLPKIIPNNLTIIFHKNNFYYYDETQEDAPNFEDEEDESGEELNQNSNFFTWKIGLLGIAAVGITYFIFKNISKNKKENSKNK